MNNLAPVSQKDYRRIKYIALGVLYLVLTVPVTTSIIVTIMLFDDPNMTLLENIFAGLIALIWLCGPLVLFVSSVLLLIIGFQKLHEKRHALARRVSLAPLVWFGTLCALISLPSLFSSGIFAMIL